MRRIWAIAVNTVKQALRMKIAVAFIVLLLVLLPVMGLVTSGDGTPKGRVQTFVSYSMSLTSLLLCLLTVIVAIYSVTSDIEHSQIYTVVTKPVYRFQILVGKFFGVLLIGFVLLVVFSSMIYSITVYTPKFIDATGEQMNELNNEFYTARASLKPAPVDVSKEVTQSFNELIRNRKISAEVLEDKLARQQILEELTKSKELASRSVGPGRQLIWEFNNVNVKSQDPEGKIFVRYKYEVSVAPPNRRIAGRWTVGDYRQEKYGLPVETPLWRESRWDVIRTFQELEVPVNVVAEDGYVAVGFVNLPQYNNTTVIFPEKDGIEVLYKSDSFTANYIRATILVLLRLIFLASLGVFTATFLSFPTAVLFCLVVFATGTISGFIFESFSTLGGGTELIYTFTVKPLVRLLPQFDKVNPARFLVPARLLSWNLLGKVAAIMVSIKAVIMILLGILIFNRREIAKIIV